ncbi:MAG: SDR family oxidoreductase [Pseudomonadota bacterium]
MQHAVVVGGTRGIGLGVTQTLLGRGWHVLATGVSAAEVAECPVEENLETAVLDVTDGAAVAQTFEARTRLDGLVNCAGILARGAEYDIEVFEKVIAVNLTGTMRTCLAAHPLLAESEGAIVNTASMLSLFGGPLVPAYAASKGGVAQLTKSLAGRWARDGIRVNAVAPGWIATEMTTALREDAARNTPILGRTPLGRWGTAEEVGQVVAFLLSKEAKFVTGAIYTADGGYSAM